MNTNKILNNEKGLSFRPEISAKAAGTQTGTTRTYHLKTTTPSRFSPEELQHLQRYDQILRMAGIRQRLAIAQWRRAATPQVLAICLRYAAARRAQVAAEQRRALQQLPAWHRFILSLFGIN